AALGAASAAGVGVGAGVVLAAAADAPAGTADDPAQLLDVEVDELAWPRPLVPQSRLEAEPTQPTHPDPGQDPRNGRERHRQRLRYLRRRHPQPAHLHDHRHPLRRGAIGNPPRRRRAIEQVTVTSAIATDPLTRTPHADTGGRCRRPQRPSLLDHSAGEPTPTAPAERRVTVQIHPSPLGVELPWTALSLQGGPDGPTASGTTSREPDEDATVRATTARACATPDRGSAGSRRPTHAEPV